MDTAVTVMELIHTDGTVANEAGVHRFSATDIDGDPDALLQELNSNTQPMTWASCSSRDTALKTIDTLPINDAVKDNLSEHVLKTGYLADPACRRFRLLIIGKSRNFTGNGIACWGTFTATAPWVIPCLIRDYIKALQTENQFQLALPFESKEIRDRVLKTIVDCQEEDSAGGWSKLPELNKKTQTSLIEAVISAGYVS